MFQWNQNLNNFHAIRNLKNLIGKLWNSDLLLLDETGQLNTSFNSNYYNNPFVASLLTDSTITTNVFQEIKEKTASSNGIQILEWKETGLSVLAIPIFNNQQWVGAIAVTGFIYDKLGNRDKIEAYLKERNFEKTANIKSVDEDSIVYLKEILLSLAEELILINESDRKRKKHLKNYSSSSFKYGNMIGKSEKMQNLYSLLDKIKHSESSILIQGENGTGKELVAQSVYQHSPRSKQAFVIQNCAALNDNLLESELFGHVRGAFTGAVQDKKGLFELADKGTLFLDEIGDTSVSMQAKLLRVLQDGQFFSVGSTEAKKVDVRIIAATNKDLRLMIEQKTFREDLYYRLNVINITVPPLRERREDIPLLIDYFLSQQEDDDTVRIFNESVMESLINFSWPGNIRELQNEVQRMSILSQFSVNITEEHLSHKFFNNSGSAGLPNSNTKNMKEAIKELERQMIKKCLQEERWNKTRAARTLGISRAALISKVKEYELEKKVIA